MILVTHPVGNQNVRSLIKTLNEQDILHSFHTSFSYNRSFIDSVIPAKILNLLLRREFNEIPEDKIYSYPFFDLTRNIAMRVGLNKLVHSNKGILSGENLYKYFDKKVAHFLLKYSENEIDTIYGYDGKCLDTFLAAKKIGRINLIYEAAFGCPKYINELLIEEMDLSPLWNKSLPLMSKATLQIQQQEAELADKIIVASNFSKKTFRSTYPNKNAIVIPYGAPSYVGGSKLKLTSEKRLKVVFVGALIQRKGISYLFDALKMLNAKDNYDVTVVGQDFSQGENKILHRHLSKYKWYPTLSHSNILKKLNEADVLVLPSLAEAFGLVVLEALSQGTTVIVTNNCGSADILDDEVDGFIVPIRSSHAIAEKLSLLDLDRDKLECMKMKALSKAKLHTWARYQDKIRQTINEKILSPQ